MQCHDHCPQPLKNEKLGSTIEGKQRCDGSRKGGSSHPKAFSITDDIIPLPPSLGKTFFSVFWPCNPLWTGWFRFLYKFPHWNDRVICFSIPELKDDSEMDMYDIQKNLKSLYEYNVMLREKFIAAQSLLNDLASKSSSPAAKWQSKNPHLKSDYRMTNVFPENEGCS